MLKYRLTSLPLPLTIRYSSFLSSTQFGLFVLTRSSFFFCFHPRVMLLNVFCVFPLNSLFQSQSQQGEILIASFILSGDRMLRLSRLWLQMAPELKLEYLPVIFTKTILGPNGGFAAEERLIKREVAQKYLDDGAAVVPTPETRQGVWCFNPTTSQFDKFVERNEEFLDFAARKRQWLDVYWRVNTGYLIVGRRSWGAGYKLNVPLRKKDVAQKLWEQYKVRIDPRLIELREKDQATGIEDLGHNWCWLYLPGAEELGIDREVYDNKRVKVRMQLRKHNNFFSLY